MTDHRVTDLAIGHPGKATYDPEEQEWRFSQTFTEESKIKQLLPFKEWISPSDQVPSYQDGRASLVILSQKRWLSKNLPETFPARSVASNLIRESFDLSAQVSPVLGSLLAIGRAHDPDRVSGFRRPQIVAMPCGAAGHMLRLIKPRIETRGWGKSSGARLSALNVESLDTGHWMSTGGAILQIVSADSENDTECWLAVRQNSLVTLFRPKYGNIHIDPTASTGQSNAPSMLNANPITSLTAHRTGSRSYSDVAFNPWFSRQIAVVDALGYWSIWEVDFRFDRRKNGSDALVPRKTGGMYDGQLQDKSSGPIVHDHFDGWYRIIWASNLSTVVVCNRRHVSVYDIKAQSTPLGKINIFPPGNTDWILDIQRSTADIDHLYVLTTSRIFWIRIISPGDNVDGQREAGGSVVLSYLHFMSPDDETLKLCLLQSEKVSVAITSANNRVVNYYAFHKPQPRGFASSRGTFSVFLSQDQIKGQNLALHTVVILPCHLVPSLKQSSGPGPKYVKDGVEFCQIWAVTADLGLFSTLVAIIRNDSQHHDITAPDTKLLLSSRVLGPKLAHEDDDFVVPDEKGAQISRRIKAHSAGFTTSLVPEKDDLRFRLDWRKLSQIVCLDDYYKEMSLDNDQDSDMGREFSQLLSLATDQLVEIKERDEPFRIILDEIIDATKQGDDMEEASSALRDFLNSLEEDLSSESPWRLSVNDFTIGTKLKFPGNRENSTPDLLQIFDHLVDVWMASLPRELPNITRHAKFKVIRQLAMVLFLNSTGISFQQRTLDKEPEIVPVDAESIGASVLSKDGRLTRDSSPFMFSSQLATMQAEPGLTLPTPTPSLYSQATSVSELEEDSKIARLRQWVPQLRLTSESTANTNRVILSHWPFALADPAKYSYEEAKKAWAVANTDEEDARSSRKEKARRRRRTEDFVKAVEPAVSRRLTLTSGSQPAAVGIMFSTQPTNDVSMTQPDRGVFGSRTVQPTKKKSKKQRTAGFK
ncbi:uncharacterized protein RCO7_03333 [Rhynchosporium graminicola]|uniref:RNA polymerase I-specific transcription initiation factor RRN6-like protein n=1 Tax=Rhynchosporium graminicola TaxID=2792576 RepID=A0A1E1L7D3_9HELO|nr:uncharacterized protein RCO7_03333 [Rhynchosporium commune]